MKHILIRQYGQFLTDKIVKCDLDLDPKVIEVKIEVKLVYVQQNSHYTPKEAYFSITL